jgi:hypothetical protein
MKEKRLFFPQPVGVASVLVIFGVLCLTVFALLAVSTVQAHSRLASPMHSAVEGYYAADSAAEEILAQLRQGQLPQGVAREGDLYTYQCPISATQTLAVAVRVDGTQYEILQWQAIPITQWEQEGSLPVWPGKE